MLKKAKDFGRTQKEITISVNGSIQKLMVTEFMYGLMEISMKANGSVS